MSWWYAVDGKKHGPINDGELSRLIGCGKVGPSAYFWRDGMASWQKLDEVEDLRRLRPSQPPPMPVAAAQDPLTYPLANAWPRFFARMFDVWWETTVVGFVAGYFLAQHSAVFVEWTEAPGSSVLFGTLCIPVAMILDAVLYAAVGNTPGKALLGLKVGTVSGARLSFLQYASRNVSVYVTGFALGVPLIGLITMAHQNGRLKRMQQASWDETSNFRVRAKPIGVVQKGIFAVAFLGVFIGVGFLNALGNERDREAASRPTVSFQWTNPQTGKSATVNPRWRPEAKKNDDGQSIYTFTEHTERASVIFAVESAPGLNLREYAVAFRKGNAANIKFDGPGAVDPDANVWRGQGRLVNLPQLMLEAEIVQVGNEYWRVVVLRDRPYDYSTAMVADLRSALWSTLR